MLRRALLLVLILGLARSDQGDPSVQTTGGAIRGKLVLDRTGVQVKAFLGIPYAEAPVGDLRFKHPVPKKQWEGVLDTIKMPYSCHVTIQRFVHHIPFLKKQLPTTELNEDCLGINVWVPNAQRGNESDNLFPVMVYFHGGGYSFGSSTLSTLSGETLAAQENVIVVTFNYRLASLGFLYLDHPDIPGNAGLHDQLLALKWVRKNAKAFGGDPNSVTLMGESAGATSALLMAISNQGRSLFDRLILMSPVIRKFIIMTKEENLAKGRLMMENLGCTGNVTSVVECVKKANPEDILGSEPAQGYSPLVFKPILDGDLITEFPEQAILNSKFPKTHILLGTNRNEGTMFLMVASPHVFQVTKDKIRANHIDYLESIHEFFGSHGLQNDTLPKIIDFHYTKWINLDDSDHIIWAFEKTINDYFFACAANTLSNVYADSTKNVFKYYYVHPAPSSYSPQWIGAYHGSQNHYVFGDVMDFKPKLPQSEIDFGKRIMRYWANFARTGNPNWGPDGNNETIMWPRYDSKDQKYMVLAPGSRHYGTKLREPYCMFWDKFLPEIGFKGVGGKI